MSLPSFGELDGQDPYEILELPSGASDAEIRAARKRLLRKYHPDLPSGDLRRTQLITAAADLLLDPLRRIGYYDLRDEESRHTVFAGSTREESRAATPGPAQRIRPTFVPGAAQRIRPTFVTPPGSRGEEPPPVGAEQGHAAPAAAARWNTVAVASVVAILTWTPIPLVLGLLALRQIRRHGQRGKRLALTGVAVGALLVVIYAYVLVLRSF